MVVRPSRSVVTPPHMKCAAGTTGMGCVVMSMPKREALGVDVGEALADEARRLLVGDVEEHVLGAGPLHLEVDGAGDDVARRELPARVVLLHERRAVDEAEDRPLAAERLA